MNQFLRVATLTSFLLGSASPLLAAPAKAGNASYHLIKKVPVPGEGGWDYLTFDASSHHLFVARSSHVSVVDVQTGELVGDLPGTQGVHGVAIDAKSRRGFTSNGRSNSVTIFDLKDLHKIAEVPVGEGPDSILFDPATRRVFTFNGEGNSSTVIDAATGKVVGTVLLPGSPEAAVADGKGHIFNNISDKNEIAQINARTLEVERVWSLGEGEEPSGIAMDRASRRLFSVCRNQKLVVTDADNGRIIATLPIGNGADGCVFDPTRHLVFSPNGRDGTLSILRKDNPNTFTTLATILTQTGARTCAFDEKTGTFFTFSGQPEPATAAQNTTAPPTEEPRRRPRYAPGSLAVLVYGP